MNETMLSIHALSADLPATGRIGPRFTCHLPATPFVFVFAPIPHSSFAPTTILWYIIHIYCRIHNFSTCFRAYTMNILHLLFSLFSFSFPDTLFERTSYLHHMYTSEHDLLVLYFQHFGIIYMFNACFEPLRSWEIDTMSGARSAEK